ncbi:DNA ligase D [Haloflavibacter putidus]|uniref:DNA ligase (ATP) n=1 Tax=Haloflavibacter putidus TaxID=2576776 RepID=A0A507ZPD1_9FLAO|nr:DNA ligase D [Haloflavibacter putidus]TQD39410.1 DNA ligase D [Haloflavibacter putidus]
MSLQEYSEKRNFNQTPEPKAKLNKSNSLRFVVQRHKARSLHYDLRLEINGVLKSWAIPKGPSMNPDDKRLAIATEDHPVEYLRFEGVIPKGNYGAGKMQIWDKGLYDTLQKEKKALLEDYRQGNLKIELYGSKLKGAFALVRTNNSENDKQWLLIKKKDKYATNLFYDAETFVGKKTSTKKGKTIQLNPEKPIKPMLAGTATKIFNHPDWIYELKWDGYRMLANINHGEVSLYSRNGISYKSQYPSLVDDLEQIPHTAILDGEVVVVDKKGISDFQAMQNYSEKTKGELRYYVFDMLFLNGHSMLNLPLKDRKSLLPELLEDAKHIFYCDHVEGMGSAFYKKAIDAGMEGVLAKKADSSYSVGSRSENWLKIKTVESREAIICGYTASHKAVFGSLILGMYVEQKLTYIGNCGTGFSYRIQQNLLQKFQALETENSPFNQNINLKGRKAHWIEPLLICEVIYSEIIKKGLLRHPVFKGLREDKNTTEIGPEKKIAKKEKIPVASSKKSETLEIDGHPVPFSNLEKVYWPESGLKKYDIIDYYLKIAETILPYLKNRPQNLHRHPNGIEQQSFYQKDNENLPFWIATKNLYSTSSQKEINYLLCQNKASLLYMANLGCIELHPWNSKVGSLTKPDYTVIDLDPSEKNNFTEVLEVTLAAKEVLSKAKVDAYCKTSGSKGIHIYIPLGAKYTYKQARDFTKLLCYYIQNKLPGLTTLERSKKNRKNRIYLDYLQNRKGQSLASAYCVRPKKYAPVSTPVSWKEIEKGFAITDFTVHNLPKRIEKKGDIFKPILGQGISIEKALEYLESK